MKPTMKHGKQAGSQVIKSTCGCCQESDSELRLPRRDFLTVAGGAVLGASAIGGVLPAGRVWAKVKSAAEPAAAAAKSSPESLVKVLYDSLSPKQRETICFAWEYQDPNRGLLRTRVANNWEITKPFINSGFYTDDQRHIIRGIFEGIISPEWHSRIDKQLRDDAGGYGKHNSIAIFGHPGADKFEFVMTGRHMTIRCDGHSADHVAFGGPIFYGHAAQGFNEEATTRATSFGRRPWPLTSCTKCSTASSRSRHS